MLACAPAPETADIARTTSHEPGDSLLASEPIPAWSTGLAGQPGRMLLPNDTALPGENYIVTMPRGGLHGLATVRDVLAQAGPLPLPFEFTIARDFLPLPGGGVSYVTRSPEPDVTCVLAIGSTTPGVPVLMRNCVRGNLSRALEPLTSSAI